MTNGGGTCLHDRDAVERNMSRSVGLIEETSGSRHYEREGDDMIAKMMPTAVRTFRSPSMVMATLVLITLTAGPALAGCETATPWPHGH